MPRVYVNKGEDAPEADGLGGYFIVKTAAELRPLVDRLGPAVKEIVINGTPKTPLDPVVRSLGIQVVRANGAWGVRNRRFFYCRSTSLDGVLLVCDELANR